MLLNYILTIFFFTRNKISFIYCFAGKHILKVLNFRLLEKYKNYLTTDMYSRCEAWVRLTPKILHLLKF